LGKIILFSQNQNYLIGVDNKNTIKSWKKSSFNNYTNINQLNKTIKSIALLENNLLAIGTCDINKIEIWNVTNKSKSFDLNDHTDCVNKLIIVTLLNKTFLISGSADATIQLYDSYLKNIQTIKENKGPVFTLEYNPDSQLIASISENNKIMFWSLSYKQSEKIRAHKGFIQAICVLKNGLIATGSGDTTIKIWKKNNQSSLELVSTLEGHTYWVTSLILLKNSSLVSGSESIKVWNQKSEITFECVTTLKQSSIVRSLVISGGSLLITGQEDVSIQIRNQTLFFLFQTLKQHKYYVKSIIVLNNENLASGSIDESIIIWQKVSETSFKFNKTLTGHTDYVTSLAVLINNMFASASNDNYIRIWDQISFQCIYILIGHTNYTSK